MDEKTCANPDCNCAIGDNEGTKRDDKMYCGEFCASSEGATLEDCDCGHADCEE